MSPVYQDGADKLLTSYQLVLHRFLNCLETFPSVVVLVFWHAGEEQQRLVDVGNGDEGLGVV